jgi:DnaJ domain
MIDFHRKNFWYVCSITNATVMMVLVVWFTSTVVDAWITQTTRSVQPSELLRIHRYASMSMNDPVKAILSSDETSAEAVTSDASQQQQPHSTFHQPTPISFDGTTTSSGTKPTLYDILGASTNATRMELKQKYVALAKMTHPDAQRMVHLKGPSQQHDATTTAGVVPLLYDFNEIATAYKILSDTKQRRRYDRSIQAEIFTEQIASAVQNHPITELTIKAIGTFAIPFFRTINKVATPSSSSIPPAITTAADMAIATTANVTTTTVAAEEMDQPDVMVTNPTHIIESSSIHQQHDEYSLYSSVNDTNDDTVNSHDHIVDVVESTTSISSETPTNHRDVGRENATSSEVLSLTDNILQSNMGETRISESQDGKIVNSTATTAATTLDNNRKKKGIAWFNNLQPQPTNAPTQDVHQLEQEAQNEYNQLLQIRQNLQQLTLQRLRVSLHTMQSGLNSNEALLLLNSFQNTMKKDNDFDDDATAIPIQTDDDYHSARSNSNVRSSSGGSLSWVDRLNFLRSSVEAEITTLQNTEMAFIQQQPINSHAQQLHQNAIRNQISIRRSLIDAERAENEARSVLERAMEETRRQRMHYERISGQLFTAEHAAAAASNELERLQNIIAKQSESVRNALIRKQRALLNNNNNSNMNNHQPAQDHSKSTNMDKPEPPMSPLFQSSSIRRARNVVSLSSLPSPLLQSSESSMLGAWPKQPFTLSQQQHESMSSTELDSYSDYDEHVAGGEDFDENSIGFDSMGTTMFDGPMSSLSTRQGSDNGIELTKLRQQEYEMMTVADATEARLSQLVEQINQIKQEK